MVKVLGSILGGCNCRACHNPLFFRSSWGIGDHQVSRRVTTFLRTTASVGQAKVYDPPPPLIYRTAYPPSFHRRVVRSGAGSGQVEPGVGRLEGYGIFCDSWAYVPTNHRQTNKAHFLAVLRALQIFTSGEVTICTDSQYVILGAVSAARRWKIRGWVGSSGPVSNVHFWEQLLIELDNTQRTIHGVKVPSHVTIDGNNEADRLAEQGRHMHPRFPRPQTPRHFAFQFATPKAPKRPKLLAPFPPWPVSACSRTLPPPLP